MIGGLTQLQSATADTATLINNLFENKMTNSEILDFIKSRRSIGNLVAPAPNREQVEQAIVAPIRPDHKDFKPVPFYRIENQALNTLGTALKKCGDSTR